MPKKGKTSASGGAKKGGGASQSTGGKAKKKKKESKLKPKKGILQHTFNENLFNHVANAAVAVSPQDAEQSRLVFEKHQDEAQVVQHRVREIAAREYSWHPSTSTVVTHPYESQEEETRTAVVLRTVASEYGTLASFQPGIAAEQAMHDRKVGIKETPGEAGTDGAGPAVENRSGTATLPAADSTELPEFVDGLKMFRLEWEPTQAQRLPAHLPRAIEAVSNAALTSKMVKTATGKSVINWAHVLPDRASAACRQLLHLKSIRAGLEVLLYKIPDTEWARSVILEKLVSHEHTMHETDETKEKLLGTTPFQAVMTMLRWSVLGSDEHNRARVDEAPRCRPANWEGMFKWGRFDATFAMGFDLLTRLLSPNPSLYEKGLTNTKASRVIHKHAAIEIAMQNNLLEILFLLIEKPKGYDTNNRLRNGSKSVLRKAAQQLAVLAETRMSKKAAAQADAAADNENEDAVPPAPDRNAVESGCMSSLWYAVYPARPQVVLETAKKKGENVYSWDRMKDKKRKAECTGHTGQFGKTTAPTPTEMAICILRGITTSYVREDAAHGVAVDRCAMIFDYEFGKPDEIPTDPSTPGSPRASMKARVKRGPRTCGDLLLALMAWIKNKGFGYEWYCGNTGKVLVETRPHRFFIGAPTRNDAWRVLHNFGTAIARVAPTSIQGGWLTMQQAFMQSSRRDGPWKGMNAALYVMKQWLKLMDREQFQQLQAMVNSRKPSYLDESIGVRRTAMLADSGYFSVTDFAAIQLAQFLQGCTPARGELVRDLGFDPESLPTPVLEHGVSRVLKAFEGQAPLAIPAAEMILRAWFGDANHEWDEEVGMDVTLGAQHQQRTAGRDQDALLHADAAAWGVAVCGPPGANVLLIEMQAPTYRAVDTSGRPIDLAPHVQITRAWFGAVDQPWVAGQGEVVTGRARDLQQARLDQKTSRTLLAQPGMWVKGGGAAQTAGATALVLEAVRPQAPLEQLQELTHLSEDSLYAQGGRSFGDHVNTISLQRSMLNVWAALVVGCHDDSVLSTVRHIVADLVGLLNTPNFAQFAPPRRGFLIALLGVSLQDPSVMPPGFWDTTCNSVLEALDYGTLRFRKNIVDDRHWVQLYLHSEKEAMLERPQIVTVKRKLLGGKKTTKRPDHGKPLFLSVVDLNGRYLQVENNTDQRLDVSGYTIRVLAREEFTDPGDLERVDVRRKLGAAGDEQETPANEAFVATFVFPKGCVLGGPGELPGPKGRPAQPATCRVWHPCVSRSYADSEILFATHIDESTGELQATFDPARGDLTWLPPQKSDAPAAVLQSGVGGHGTTWLDPMVKRDKATVAFLRRAVGHPEVRDSLPEVPYSTPFTFQGVQLFLFSAAGELVQKVDLGAPPPAGTCALDGSGKLDRTLPMTTWFEHGNATSRTATQWADPDRVNVGFHGLFVEPGYVLEALRRLSLLPRHAYQLIQRGALAAVVDLLLELRLLRLEQKNVFHKASCFDATELQRVLSEIAALDQVCALVQPFSTRSRRMFCSLILPEMQRVEAEPPLFPLEMGGGEMFAWDVVDDGRAGTRPRAAGPDDGGPDGGPEAAQSPEWAPSSWAAQVNLGQLLLHFEADMGTAVGAAAAADFRVRELAAVAWTSLCLRERLAALVLDSNSDRTPLEQLVGQTEEEYAPTTQFDVFVAYAERVNVDDPMHVQARKDLKNQSRQGFEDAYRRLAIIFSAEMPKLESAAREMAQQEARAAGGQAAGESAADSAAASAPMSGKCLMPQRRTPRLQISDRVKRTRNPFLSELQDRRGRRVKGVPAGVDAETALRSGEHGVSHCPSQIVASVLRSRAVLLLLGPEFFESEYCKLELRIALLHRSKLVPVFVAPGYTVNDVPTEFREDIRSAGWCWHINMWRIKSYSSLLEYTATEPGGENADQGGHLNDIIDYIRNPDPMRRDLVAAEYMLARPEDEYSDYFSAACPLCARVRPDLTENLRTNAEACDECWTARVRPSSAAPSPTRTSASVETSAADRYGAPHEGACPYCARTRPDVRMNMRTQDEACEECWSEHVEGFPAGREYAQPEGTDASDDGYLHIAGATEGAEPNGYAQPDGNDGDAAPMEVDTASGNADATADAHQYATPEGGQSDELWAHPPPPTFDDGDGPTIKMPTPDYDTDATGETDAYLGFHGDAAFEEEEDTYFGAEPSVPFAGTAPPPAAGVDAADATDSDSDDDAGALDALWKYHLDDDALSGDIEAAIAEHEDESAAATKIQAAFRGKVARDATRGLTDAGLDDDIEGAIAAHEEENAAALTIQAAFRGKQGRDSSKATGQQAIADDIESAVAAHEAESAAATTIQAAFRGKQARDELQAHQDESLHGDIEAAISQHEEESAAAATIQAAFRGKQARDAVGSQRDEALDSDIEATIAAHERESGAASTIQAGFRGMQARRTTSDMRESAAATARETAVSEEAAAAAAQAEAAQKASKPAPPPKPAALSQRPSKPTPPPKPKALAHATSSYCATCGAKQPAKAARFCPKCGAQCAELAEREETAAVKIQAGFRGMSARRQLAAKKAAPAGAAGSSDSESDSDSDIDEEEALAEYLAEAQKELETATIKIQSAFRGSKARSQVRAMRASQPTAAHDGSSDISDDELELTAEELAEIEAELAGSPNNNSTTA
eukprot:m.406437 g.406437  ORF g.406437 m.406437 type:complete len:2639 (+) comp28436_c0_seq2:95-8011(+)